MRRLLLALAVLLAIVALFIALAAARLDSYLDGNRDWLETQVEARLGRRVTFDALRVGFRGGLSAEVTNLRVGEGTREDSPDVLQAERAQVRLRILPALLGHYEVASVAVHRPTITVIRSAEGLNVSPPPSADAPSAATSPAPGESSKDVGMLAALIVHAITVGDGEVVIVDRTRTPPVEMRLHGLDLGLTDVSLGAPIKLDLSATVFASDEQDISLSGTIGPLVAPGTSSMRPNQDVPIDLQLQLGPLTIADLRRQPAIANQLPAWLDAEAPIEISASIKGSPAAFAVDGSFDAGDTQATVTAKIAGTDVEAAIRSPEGGAGSINYSELAADISFRAGVFAVSRFTTQMLGGACTGSAEYDRRDPARPTFHVKSTARSLDLAALLALSASKETPKMTGRLDADLDLSGVGADRRTIESSAAGTARVTVRDGVLKDVNIVEQALQRLTGAPGLTDLLNEKVRRKYPGIFSSGDTRFDTLQGSARIGGARATTDDLTLATRDYSLRAKGWISFAQRMDLTATLTASPALSTDLIAAAKQVELLTNDRGQIAIPVILQGPVRKPKVVLDPAFVGRTLERALQTGVDSLLRGKKRDKRNPNKTPRPEVDLLKKGLDSLFRR